MPDHTTAPLTTEREQEIRDSIPTVYTAPWTVEPMEDNTWRVMYATDHPLAGLVAEVPDYGAQLAEFIAEARTAVPELLAEIRRLRTELRIGAPWKCHVCGKDNHRDVCLICETDRPDGEPAHETQTCPAALLPFGTAPADRCVVEGRHSEHVTAEGRRWTVEEQPDTEACGKCKQPFDPTDMSFDSRARHNETPYCRGCVGRCHDTEIADHRCVICG